MFALHYFHWQPRVFLSLDRKERAAVMAMIDYKIAMLKENH
ncbi:MAG: hypothetical protein RSH79_07910 [Clostridiales bacterium]